MYNPKILFMLVKSIRNQDKFLPHIQHKILNTMKSNNLIMDLKFAQYNLIRPVLQLVYTILSELIQLTVLFKS